MKWPLVTRRRYDALQLKCAELVKQNNDLLLRDAKYSAIQRHAVDVASKIRKYKKATR